MASYFDYLFSLLVRIARTTYVDVAYCYRPSSVVCRSVDRSITVVSSVITAEPIEMPIGLRTQVSAAQEAMYRMGSRSPWEGAILRRKEQPIVKYKDTPVICGKTALKLMCCRLGCGLGLAEGITN